MELLLLSSVTQAAEYREVNAEINVSDISAHIEKGDDIYLDRCIIYGDLNLSKIKLETMSNPRYNKYLDSGYNGEWLKIIGISRELKIVEGNIKIQNSVFNDTVDFSNVFFENTISLKGTTLKGSSNFNGATFKSSANFNGTIFKGFANFCATTFKKSVSFNGTIFKGSANFRETVFKDSANFNGATFTNLNSIKWITFNNSELSSKIFLKYFTNTRASILSGSIPSADFQHAIFESNVSFENVGFESEIHFQDSVFKGPTNFKGATFGNSTPLMWNIFNNYAYLIHANLYVYPTDFMGATFGNYTSFEKAIFENCVLFYDTKFEGYADFSKATFKGYTSFNGATFGTFSGANYLIDYTLINCSANFMDVTFKDYTSFNSATFENSVFFLGTTFEDYADFSRVSFKEIATDYHTPSYIYVSDGETLQKFNNYFKDRGRYEDADTVYYNYRKICQAQKKWSDTSKWIDVLESITCGYGVRPFVSFLFAILNILLFSVIYANPIHFHINRSKRIPISFSRNVLFERSSNKIIPFKLFLKNPGIIKECNQNQKTSVLDLFYYSIGVFTFISQGSWYPRENFRKWVTLEGILGWATLGIFMATLTAVMIRS